MLLRKPIYNKLEQFFINIFHPTDDFANFVLIFIELHGKNRRFFYTTILFREKGKFMNTPLVSIGLPVYNEAQFIRQTLDCILTQKYTNFELIISDNASTDETFFICQEYAARDNRIILFKQSQNVGSGPNFMKPLELAKGRYFAFISGHDMWHPNFLSRCVEVLLQSDAIVLCFPQATSIDAENHHLGMWSGSLMDTMGLDPISRLHITLWTAVYMYPFCGVYCLPTFKKLTTWQSTKVIGPDNLLIAELSLHGFFYHIKEPLLYLRQNRAKEQDTTPAYIERIYGKPLSEMSSYQITGETIQQFVGMLARYIQDEAELNRVALSIVNCLITRRHFKVVFNNVICSNPNNHLYPSEWNTKFPNLYTLLEKLGAETRQFIFEKPPAANNKVVFDAATVHSMSIISMFYGILIQISFHNIEKYPAPHIYADYQGHLAVYSILDGSVLEGELPMKKHKLIIAWIEIHQEDLLTNWQLIINRRKPFSIKGLD